ncbi:hypothetical protein ACFP56_06715 [Paenibacillus septentrionalis]|uniref:Uncharacterized protein n=1 Tax=Paenibacillus septentrionalis TaxID=429342 RepID=A0ABW1V365_9BACL
MSRKEKFSRYNRKNQHETGIPIHNELEKQGDTLPPRTKKHPSNKAKLTKVYYNVVFFLFVSLVVFLLWYGNNYYNLPKE